MGDEQQQPDAVRRFVRHADAVLAIDDELWQPISLSAIARSAPQFGETVLDACCGTGASAVPTAELVGPEGVVDAVDAAAPMIELARTRAEAAGGLPRLRLHVGDVREWEPAGYDLVQCVLGVFFFDELDDGTRALIGRARPGGRVAITVWQHGAFHSFRQALADAVAEVGGGSPDAPQEADRTPGTTGAVAGWLHELGLERVRADAVPRHLALDDDLAWRLVLGTGRRSLLDGLGKKARRRVRERFTALLAERGIDRVDASTITAVGVRPA